VSKNRGSTRDKAFTDNKKNGGAEPSTSSFNIMGLALNINTGTKPIISKVEVLGPTESCS
jgi:hypothetical protein